MLVVSMATKCAFNRFTSHITHSFSFEDNTGRFVCLSGFQEVWTNGSASLLCPHSGECDEPTCSSTSAALTKRVLMLKLMEEKLLRKSLQGQDLPCGRINNLHNLVEI